MTQFKKHQGFTLLEVLLVLVIVSSMLYMFFNLMQQKTEAVRRTRVVLQMQQILDAGLSYYVTNSKWPPATSASSSMDALQGNDTSTSPTGTTVYLTPKYGTVIDSPWNQPFFAGNSNSLFYVYTEITNTAHPDVTAQIIAGMLPMSYTATSIPASPDTLPAQAMCATTATSCYVVSTVNIPGYNLNNARAVNFAGLYHYGACVPVPTCPVDPTGTQMIPQIVVVPVQVTGLNDQPSGCTADANGNYSCTNMNAYPLTSFTAYATGPGPGANPAACGDGGITTTCYATPTTTLTTGTYWRVCLSLATEKGTVTPSNDLAWGQLSGTIMAITRCATAAEAAQGNTAGGSSLNVWTK